MSNNISMVCRLGKDSEVKEIGSHKVLEMNVVNSTGFGEREISTWYKATIWGKRSESLQQHLTKGKQVFLTGEFCIRTFDKKDGGKGFSAEIKVSELSFVGGGGSDSQGGSSSADDDSDSLPF